MASNFDPQKLVDDAFRATRQAQPGAGQNATPSVPAEYDNSDTNSPNQRRMPPPNPEMVRQLFRSDVERAAAGAISDAANDPAAQDTIRQRTRAIVGSLGDMAATSAALGQIRAWATSPRSVNHGLAEQAAAAQHSLIANAADAAQKAFAALEPALLGAVYPKPDGVKDDELAQRKDDIVSALRAAGQSGANAAAQRMIDSALAANDAAALYVLVGAAPLRYLADGLNIKQSTLQRVYVQRMIAKYPDQERALLNIGHVPGGALIQMLPAIKSAIAEQRAASDAAINAALRGE